MGLCTLPKLKTGVPSTEDSLSAQRLNNGSSFSDFICISGQIIPQPQLNWVYCVMILGSSHNS